MSLPDVSTLLPTDQQHQQSLQRLEMVHSRSFAVFQNMGFQLVPRPGDFDGDLPQNISDFNSENLSLLHVKMSAFSAYAFQQMMIAEGQRDSAEIALKRTRALVRLKLGSRNQENKKYTVDDKTDMMTVDARVAVAEENYLTALTVWRLIKVISEKSEKGIAAISRYMTMRVAEMERGKIEQQRANIPMTMPSGFARPGIQRNGQ